MNIAFTGTNDHASLSTIMEAENSPRKIVSHKMLCILDNNGKKKDAYEFENLLDEFKYSKNPKDKNKIMIEVINDISEKDIGIILGQDEKKLKNEYKPNCLCVRINGKPVNIFKNNSYIFKKLQSLVNDIRDIRPIDLLFEEKTMNKKEVLFDMIGQDKFVGNEKEVLSNFYNPENVKMTAAMISTSLHNVIKNLVGRK
jgi:hypothetical protein